MAIKCPSDGCSWTGELRNKEVMDSVLVIHKSNGPRLFHPPLPSVLSIYVLHFQMTEGKSFNAVIQAEGL